MKMNAKDFGLSPRTEIERVSETTIGIIIQRKSRIIMADGRKILEKVEAIHNHLPKMQVIVKTTAPVCSKTTLFLQEHGVEIHSM